MSTSTNAPSKPVEVYRAWINQPSTLQPRHDLHGRKGIVVDHGDPYTVRIYFAEGDLISAEISRLCLSK